MSTIPNDWSETARDRATNWMSTTMPLNQQPIEPYLKFMARMIHVAVLDLNHKDVVVAVSADLFLTNWGKFVFDGLGLNQAAFLRQLRERGYDVG